MTTEPPPFNAQPPVPPRQPPLPAGWRQQPVPAPQTSVLAVVSLIAGLLWFFWVGSVVAIITGHKARRQVRELGYAGDTLAILGLVFGYLGAGSFVLFVVFPLMIGAASGH